MKNSHKRLGIGLVPLFLALAAMPAAAFSFDSAGMDGAPSEMQLVAASAKALAGNKRVERDLLEAVALRQAIRRYLFDNGTRVSKEQIGKAEGDASGWSFFGFGSMGGKFKSEQFELTVKGGETFVVAAGFDPVALSVLNKMKAYRAGKPGLCQLTEDLYRKLQPLSAWTAKSAASLPELQTRLARFQNLLDSIEQGIIREGASKSAIEKYNEVRAWAIGSQIRLLRLRPASSRSHGFVKLTRGFARHQCIDFWMEGRALAWLTIEEMFEVEASTLRVY